MYISIQVLPAASSMSVEKSSDFSADFRIFGGIFARIKQEKDLERKIDLNEVFIFTDKQATLFILNGTNK